MATETKQPATAQDANKIARMFVSPPRELHGALALLSKDKNVSVARVVQDAAEYYADEKQPLFQLEAT
jgi:hypothetical protein